MNRLAELLKLLNQESLRALRQAYAPDPEEGDWLTEAVLDNPLFEVLEETPTSTKLEIMAQTMVGGPGSWIYDFAYPWELLDRVRGVVSLVPGDLSTAEPPPVRIIVQTVPEPATS